MRTAFKFSLPRSPRVGGRRGTEAIKGAAILAQTGKMVPAIIEPDLLEGFTGTAPEGIVYKYLTENKIEFEYQSPLQGGRLTIAGSVADFILIYLGIILRVQGDYWHYGDIEKEASDILQKERQMLEGWNVIDLKESDLMERPGYVLRQALLGIQVAEEVFV